VLLQDVEHRFARLLHAVRLHVADRRRGADRAGRAAKLDALFHLDGVLPSAGRAA